MKLVVQEMSGAGMVQAARAGQVPDLYVASQKTLMALKEKIFWSLMYQTGQIPC